ncbi:MAG: 4Fe-4S cluster-binding domain-containing protein, partial [Clostridia bacterium]|nr:4Fe-4S cluster-binding domain-containing protein [Clostridia bacterium]
MGLLLSGRAIFLRQLWKGWRHGCIVPRDLLIDPTSACNLRCRGCWAADYGREDQLSFDELDRIFDQCEELLLTDILMTGGEPLLRK